VTVSPRAAKIEEAQIFLKPGEQVPVKELFTAMLVYSANDATVALAEHVGGSEEAFVEMMNQKAKALGMVHTHYRCASGLDMHLYPDPPNVPGEHVMSAQDSAILARELIKTYPEVLKTTSMPNATFLQGTDHAQKKPNWNKMLPGFKHFYDGVDGLKTGHTNEAGYCFTGTAKQRDYRLVTVVMGTASDDARFSETSKLLDYGFGSFQPTELVAKNGKVAGKETLALPNGVERTVPVVANEKILIPTRIGEEGNYTIQVQFKQGIQAPLSKGDVVGEARVLYKNQPVKGVAPIQMVAAVPMEEASDFQLFFRKAGDTIKSWIN
jgi:D-alanyl-D-alanine carboxypeptidase (penicillin-binding protein 5/6)